MKQKLFTLLTLLLVGISSAWATDVDLTQGASFDFTTIEKSDIEDNLGSDAYWTWNGDGYFSNNNYKPTTATAFMVSSTQEITAFAGLQCITGSSTGRVRIYTNGNGLYFNSTNAKLVFPSLKKDQVITIEYSNVTSDEAQFTVTNASADQNTSTHVETLTVSADGDVTLTYNSKKFFIKTINISASGPKDGVFTISKSTIAPGETAKILLDGEDKFATNFTAGTLWESEAGGPYVELSSDGIVTAVKNTPVGYYFTFTANSKDLEKYNTSTGVSIDVAVATPTCTTPTITTGAFNFENKGYEVTITSTEDGSTLKVSTDGSSYTTQTSPYVTYATATTHYYAKSEKASYYDSDVADLNVENTFDGGKKYIAWVYTSDYSTGSGKPNYAFATDPMVIALKTVYNVVPVDYAQSVTPSADLKNADLIVCSEAMSGDKTMSNGMVDLLDGTAPMIGLKMYNYGAGSDATKRWKWGLPANPTSTVYGFTAKNAHYKVLDGVTFESDGTIKLATDRFNDSSYKNVIQTANFTGASKPADNVILGTLGSDDEKAVMHYSATKKYFGLGLSCDCWEYYTANATTIVKNAAAMLIAGEDLTAANAVAQVTGKITAAGWTTFSSSEKLDLSTISGGTAYYASGVNGTNAVLTPTGDVVVAAGTGLMIKGTPGDDFTIDVTDAAVTFAEENLLEGLPNGGTVAAAGSGYNYVFGWASAHPEAPGFYKVNGTSAVLGSGKAYLHTTAELADPGALLGLIFDEESDVTGIKNLTPALSQGEGAVFDLQGRQVAQPAKGLYIVNGKKVVLK